MKTLAILALTTIAVGCQPRCETSYQYQVTSDFTDAEFAVMLDESAHLCDVNDGRCIEVTREERDNKVIIGDLEEGVNGTLRDYSNGLRGIIIVKDAIDRGILRRTFRHEIGHAAGCLGPGNGHSDRKTDVMFGYYDRDIPDPDWTKRDLDCINQEWD
jgi:hypothetical protein